MSTSGSPIEPYLQNADALAQSVVNIWGMQMHAGNAERLTTEFKELVDVACRYQEARNAADSFRQFGALNETDAEAREKLTRHVFVEAYRAWEDKHRD